MSTIERDVPDHQAAQEPRRLELEAKARQLAAWLDELMPPGAGFGIVLFDRATGGYMSWISSGRREDMKKALEEMLARWNGEARG